MSFVEESYSHEAHLTHNSSHKYKMMFLSIYVLVIACLFYSTGNFGLLNIFGIRRELQVMLLLSLLPLSLKVFANFINLLKHPIFLLVFLNLVIEFVLRDRTIYLLDRLSTVLVIGILLSFNKKYSDNILKFIIAMAAVFSTMAILEAIFVLFKPELIQVLSVNYSSLTQAGKLELSHPLSLLGFTSSVNFEVFGHTFTRFRSFASEPSVLVYSFFVPGILALSYRGRTRLLCIPILFFSILLTQSGTIWLSILLGIIIWGFYRVIKTRNFSPSILPFFVIIIFFIIVLNIDIPIFMTSLTQSLTPVSDIYAPLNKYTSGVARLSSIYNILTSNIKYYFGMPFSQYSTGIGFLGVLYLHSGIIGLILGIIISYQIFKRASYCFNMYRGIIRLATALIIGMFIQVLTFSSYGWSTLPGFLMILLLMNRLDILAKIKSKFFYNSPDSFQRNF